MIFSYCTNIHPAESWEETLLALRMRVPTVRLRLRRAATDPFPLGLRLSARAADELAGDRSKLRAFRRWMEDENILPYTINGFPFGRFHGTRVKENVFLPDWSTPERLAYTLRLFHLLCDLLPDGDEGSVSTSPVTLRALAAAEPERVAAAVAALRKLATELERLSVENHLDLHAGLEPEPSALLEDTPSTLSFFDRLLDGLGDDERAVVLRRIGVCYDACHFAIAYEHPGDALAAMHGAGIRLSKVHLSNALALDGREPAALAALAAFDEPVYLHQVVARHADGTKESFADLPEAMASASGTAADEWRVHFHIPVYAQPQAPLRSTISDLDALAGWLQAHPGACRHFEVETYTFDALPAAMRRPTVDEMLAAEIRWCETRFFPLVGPGGL